MFFSGFRFQRKIAGFETAVHYFALHLGFSDSIAETVFGMGIAERINVNAINKIGFAFYPYGQVAGGTG